MSPFKLAATVLTVAVAGCASQDGMVVVGTASQIEVTSGDGQAAVYGTTLPRPLVVRVTDQSGHPIPGAVVTFATNGLGTLDRYMAMTDSGGYAQVLLSYSARAGIDSVTATVAGIATPARFSETATAGAPVALFLMNNNLAVLAGTPIEIAVRAEDAAGNPAPGADLVWTWVGLPITGVGTELAENVTGSDGLGRLDYKVPSGLNYVYVSLDHSAVVLHFVAQGY